VRCGRYATQRLPGLKDRRGVQTSLGNNLGGHPADAGAGQPDRTRSGGRKVEDPAADERAAVVDGDDDAAAAMGHPELGAEREGTMGRGQGVLIETLARGGPAAGFIAVVRGHPRKAASETRRRGDRGVGVAPEAGGRVARVMGMAMAIMMPVGFGRGFGDASADQESCGENSERRARLGYSSQCRFFEF